MNTLATFNSTITNERTQNYLKQVLGEKRASFVNNITSLVSNNAMLQDCDPLTILYAGLKATALDLPLDNNLGFAYVLPYNDSKAGKKVGQFQLGYKAFIQLAMRSGQFKTINVREVKEGEIVSEDFVSGEIQFRMLTENREEVKTIGYIAYFRLINGFEKMLYMCNEKLEKHGKKFSQTYKKGYGLWKDDFDSMARKTVLKLLLSRYAPLSVEMQTAIKSDQAIISEKGEVYVDNQNYSDTNQKAAEIIGKAFEDIEDVKEESKEPALNLE